MSHVQTTTSEKKQPVLQAEVRPSRRSARSSGRAALCEEVRRVRTAIEAGDLQARTHTGGYEDADWELLTEINAALEVVTRPLTVASCVLAKIAKGDVPEQIAEQDSTQGELKELQQNIAASISTMEALYEIKSVLQLMSVNDYTRKVQGNHPGVFGEVGAAVNLAQSRVVHAIEIAKMIADGNFREKLDALKKVGKRSDNDTFVPAFIKMMDAIVALVDDADSLATAAIQGKLTTRVDANRHQGDYRKVMEGVNATLDAVIGPLSVASECFDKIGRGQVPQAITTDYNGDFAVLKNSVNSCINGLRGLQEVNTVLQLIAVNDYTKNVEGRYPGLFGEVATATNQALMRLHSAVEALHMTAEGNFRDKLTAFKKIGKRSENDTFVPGFIKMMESIVALVDDANLLAEAAVQGKLTTRADAGHHQGDYRRVVEGVNATLDAVIGPLQEIEHCLGKLANGDFTTKMEGQYAGTFNEVKSAVNTMVVQVRGALLKIGKETGTLASASQQLGNVSQQMSASAEETAAQANVVSAASEQVSTNIQTVATGADEMGASIKEIAKNTADATKIANNAVQLSKTTNETVRKLGTSSAEIGQVIKVITSIAQQTNLLALNATIEAARAGEAGKGFAVVANEVKELAKQTAQATEDISQKIQAIQQDASGAVTAIGEITEVIGQISDIQNTVATAIEEQSATTNEISRNLAEAAKGGADITLNITSVAQVAKTTTEAAGQTQMSAKSLAETASQLRELVSQFRYEDSEAKAPVHSGR